MKKISLLLVSLVTIILVACSNQNAKQEAAQAYCDSTEGVLTMSGDNYICTYEDGSACVSTDFNENGCEDLILGNDARLLLETSEGRIDACEDKTLFYLNWNDGEFLWNDEVPAGGKFVLDGSVAYIKPDGTAADYLSCVVDAELGTVSVEFKGHFLYDADTEEWIEQ